MRYLYAGILFIGLVGIYIWTYLANRRTPKPEGCEDKDGACDGCALVSCGNHPLNNDEEGEK